MKKTILGVVLALTAGSALAQQGGFVDPNAPTTATSSAQSGFQDPNAVVVTVQHATTLSDDAWVTLKGKIEKRLTDDNYLFRDDTGTITVDIDHKRWNGVTVTPNSLVEIQGKVDKKFSGVEIDVKHIKVLK